MEENVARNCCFWENYLSDDPAQDVAGDLHRAGDVMHIHANESETFPANSNMAGDISCKFQYDRRHFLQIPIWPETFPANFHMAGDIFCVTGGSPRF